MLKGCLNLTRGLCVPELTQQNHRLAQQAHQQKHERAASRYLWRFIHSISAPDGMAGLIT